MEQRINFLNAVIGVSSGLYLGFHFSETEVGRQVAELANVQLFIACGIIGIVTAVRRANMRSDDS